MHAGDNNSRIVLQPQGTIPIARMLKTSGYINRKSVRAAYTMPFFDIAEGKTPTPKISSPTKIGCTPRGSCSNTLLRRVLRRFFKESASWKGS